MTEDKQSGWIENPTAVCAQCKHAGWNNPDAVFKCIPIGVYSGPHHCDRSPFVVRTDSVTGERCTTFQFSCHVKNRDGKCPDYEKLPPKPPTPQNATTLL